jgi:rhodanese-related sulfurtransferase
MKTTTQALLSVLSFVLSLGAQHAFAADAVDCSKNSHYPVISKTELKKVADEKSATILDVNSSESFAQAHVPGAIHFAAHEKDLASVLPAQKDALIVAYCGGVRCGAWKKAAEAACKMGYTNIRHYKEGIQGWTAKS